MNTTKALSPIERAIEKVGSASALAAALQVSAAAVGQWKSGERRIPAERCPEIERATGGAVRCEDLRPDVAWDVLRMQAGEVVGDVVAEAAPAGAAPQATAAGA